MHKHILLAFVIAINSLVMSIPTVSAEPPVSPPVSNDLEQADTVILVGIVAAQLNAAGQKYYMESQTNVSAETPAIIAAAFGSGSNFLQAVESERQAAISERRAFGIHGTNILLLGIGIGGQWIPAASGKARFATRVIDPGGTRLYTGDLIIECNGMQIEPGRGLSVVVNAGETEKRRHRLLVIRDGNELEIDLEARVTHMSPEQIADRRKSDAIETVVFSRMADRTGKSRALPDWSVIEKKACAIFEAVRGTRTEAVLYFNLGSVHDSQGEYAKAEGYCKRALAITEKFYGPEHPDVARSLNNLSYVCYRQGDYAKAEGYCKRALAIQELGAEHPDMASSLNNLGNVYYRQGDYAEAEEYWKRALAITEKFYGPEHPDIALSLNNLGDLYDSQGDYAKAEKYHTRSLAIAEKFYGPEHPDVARSLNNLGGVYYRQGDCAKAEEYWKRALAITEKFYGPEHPDMVSSLNNIGSVYYSQGDYAKAEEYWKRMLAITEKFYGPEHPDVARSLSNLGDLYDSQGEYAKAEEYCKRALAITEKFYGPEHPDVARSLSNLGSVYFRQGDYAKAEEYWKRTLAITEKFHVPEHPDIALSLNNLGNVYDSQGDYAKAEEYWKRALAITEKFHSQEHPDMVSSLNNLGGVYFRQGDYAKAEGYWKRTLAIIEKFHVPEHPLVANPLNNLGNVYDSQGEYAKAEEYHLRALAIREIALGAEHPDMVSSLNNLGNVYASQGDYAKAEEYCKRALARQELGAEHPDMASSLNNLGNVYASQGDYAKAEEYWKRALAITERFHGPEHPDVASSLCNISHVSYRRHGVASAPDILLMLERALLIQCAKAENIFSFSSEEQRLNYVARQGHGPLTLMCTLAKHGDKPARDAACLWTLRTKGVVLDSTLEDRQNLFGNTDAIPVFAELKEVESRISHLQFGDFKNMTVQELKAQRERLTDLNARKDVLKQELARLVPRYREGRRAAHVTIEQVQESLAKNEALVEFVAFFPYGTEDEMKAGLTISTNDPWFPPVYIAFLIKSDCDDPELVSIGDASEINELIAVCGEKMTNGGEVEGDLRKLYEKVWLPLEKSIEDKSRIIISPDHELHFLAFGALIGPDDKHLIERFTIGYTSSGRDLVRRFDDTEATNPVLFGDPDYGFRDVEDNETDWLARGAPSSLAPSRIGEADREVYLGHTLKRLPGTRKEVKNIELLLDNRHPAIYVDASAREEILKSVQRPSILHLATHGFFFENVPMPTNLTSQMMMGIQDMPAQPVPRGNPMHRSGLALAGANLALQGRTPPEGVEDGIVTAEEVGGLDLWGTDLVALSACMTARGDVYAGEGVMGLRRAFVQAGARNLLLTMWRVEDQFTSDLMLAFYSDFLKTGDAIGAMTRVQRAALAEAKKRNEPLHPSFWAPFLISIQGSPSESR